MLEFLYIIIILQQNPSWSKIQHLWI